MVPKTPISIITGSEKYLAASEKKNKRSNLYHRLWSSKVFYVVLLNWWKYWDSGLICFLNMTTTSLFRYKTVHPNTLIPECLSRFPMMLQYIKTSDGHLWWVTWPWNIRDCSRSTWRWLKQRVRLHLADVNFWEGKCPTYLVNRALAKASLILHPPENSL